MRRYTTLLFYALRTSLLLSMQYRWEFIGQGIAQLLWMVLGFLPLLMAFLAQPGGLLGGQIAGWGFYPALAVYGVFCLLRAILEGAIHPSLVAVVDQIRKGTLDFLLIKPADAQFLVSTTRFEPWRLIDATGAVVVVIFALVRQIHVQQGATPVPSISWILTSLLIVLCAVAMLYSLWVLVICAAFYLVRVDNLSYLFHAIFDFGRWPRSIFRGGLALLFTYVIPLCVMTSYPVEALLGRTGPWEVSVAVFGAAGMLVLCRLIWKRAIQRYSSASS